MLKSITGIFFIIPAEIACSVLRVYGFSALPNLVLTVIFNECFSDVAFGGNVIRNSVIFSVLSSLPLSPQSNTTVLFSSSVSLKVIEFPNAPMETSAAPLSTLSDVTAIEVTVSPAAPFNCSFSTPKRLSKDRAVVLPAALYAAISIAPLPKLPATNVCC